ncbi:TetR/AcrR family transcriptional regulator [Desulfosporosinus sp.]|uniref:TetR/AcrR family transcriptional regulator n=1 Tax=Desulfosporosinus sp. TaxID=157907 RepID=UPI000E8B4B1F|nr:TetR/AcrR family transcriptional regulator [Desulfosporosinus sp.]MBC2722218.1 TetR/AcrR family transcriptional regulator [Desulfosporosinus sp.]MBC2728556.1 TetR/AcrR family transcriptional regulator [Desulfosporosinus sp.]HBV86215.1 TetR family transcriptional regulator [Desulfosporosinus sp.]
MDVQREIKFQRILDAAIEAFAESGFHQCQVNKIARLAGVADGTIYLYFKSKEDVLIRVFQDRMGKFITGMSRELSQCKTTEARLRTIVRTHFSYMEENRSVAIVTQLELRQSDPRVRLPINSTVSDYFNLIEGVIQQGIDCGEVPKIDKRIARQLIFGALDEATSDWVMARSPRTLISGIEPMTALFKSALRLKEEPKKIKRGAVEPKREEDGNADS